MLPNKIHKQVNELTHYLMAELQTVLGEKLIGVYVYGSLVSGEFDENISDIDLLVVTDFDLDENDFSKLNEMHTRIIKEFKMWHDRLEIAYISKQVLGSFKHKQGKIAVISPGESFNIKEAIIDWLMNWYLIQENSLILFGPDPRTLIEHISKNEFLEVVKTHALNWREWVEQTKNSQQFQSYAILTICRSLYSFHIPAGHHISKKAAAKWAQERFPEWNFLVEQALKWRSDAPHNSVDSLTTYPQVQKFINEMLDRLIENNF